MISSERPFVLLVGHQKLTQTLTFTLAHIHQNLLPYIQYSSSLVYGRARLIQAKEIMTFYISFDARHDLERGFWLILFCSTSPKAYMMMCVSLSRQHALGSRS